MIMTMQTRDDDLPWPADPQREAAVLGTLRAEFPALAITAHYLGHTRAWEARGQGGRPWLVMSDNLGWFRAALRR